MSFELAFVAREGGGLFGNAAAFQHAPCYGVGKVLITQFGNGDSLSMCLFGACGIPACSDKTKQAPGFSAGAIWSPWRTMPTDCEPALAILSASVEQEIDDSSAFLSAGTETADGRIPNNLVRLERVDIADADAFSHVSTQRD